MPKSGRLKTRKRWNRDANCCTSEYWTSSVFRQVPLVRFTAHSVVRIPNYQTLATEQKINRSIFENRTILQDFSNVRNPNIQISDVNCIFIYSINIYSRCPKSERSDFSIFRFDLVVKQFRFRYCLKSKQFGLDIRRLVCLVRLVSSVHFLSLV